MKVKNIIINSLALMVIISMIFVYFYAKRANEMSTKFELLAGNKWYEMVGRECGYEDNDDDDYCRGFSDGYDYAAAYFQIDCATRELYPNDDNPNLYKN